ncbi:hypothetical protein [Planococcus halotolerans]|uniref:hypothetical protein n=1 Tax=Planococcus halotolerans TaxID=2233542 RepID=UPI001092BFA8|nr:hypothetical protein [Planococcus halotolerans]QHJ70665.1 hypothetical protein DNR44_008645 [Planococcus halotolerans]
MKRFLYYLIWTLVIGFIVYMGTLIQADISETASQNFILLPPIVFLALFPVVIGVLMRLPKFLLERKERRAIGFDWFKFLAVGLPSLYVVLMTFLPFTSLRLRIPSYMLTSEYAMTTIAAIAGIVFGYILLDCFHKPEAASSKNVSQLRRK